MSPADKDAVIAWLSGTDTGASSKALAREAAGLEHPRGYAAYPSDGSDLGRCVRLIDKVPPVRGAVNSLAEKSPYWKALAPEWDRLVETYRAEMAGGKRGSTYDAMNAILLPVERNDTSVIRLGPGVSVRFGQ